MKKLVSILAILITVPSFATDITGSSDCDNDTLGTYSAPVDMEAKWTANTINLQWYDDENDSNPASTMCTYNTTISLPAEPSKPGYNFAGWQLRQIFDLSTLNANIDGTSHNSKNFAGDNCYYQNNQTFDSISSDTCTESVFTSLNNGEWETTFSYGTVKGVALCSSTDGGTYAITGTPDETGTGTTRYCWCKASGFAEPNSNTYVNVASPVWVFRSDLDVSCSSSCAFFCAGNTLGVSEFRQAIYGITQ